MNTKISLCTIFLILTACSTTQPEPTDTLPPTSTPFPVPTETPILLMDISGSLFFDYNGSGLLDEGEPPIAGFGVCTKPDQQDWVCTQTNEQGIFLFEKFSQEGEQVLLKFEDPNADDPALAFRYINIWHGPVVIEAYEMNGVQVPEQHLNDTEVLPIDEIIYYEVGDEIELGLMQGFLTLPIYRETQYLLWSFYDLDHEIGSIRDWSNSNLWAVDPYINISSPNARPGVSDQHQGVDYNLSLGTPIIAMAEGKVGFIRDGSGDNPRHVTILHQILSKEFESGYGHNSINLVKLYQYVYRGQIIGLSGNDSGCCSNYKTQPHIHVNFTRLPYDIEAPCVPYANGQCAGLGTDPWRDVLDNDSISYWTKDNDPQYP